VPLAGKVFRQLDAAGPEASLLSIAGDDFDRAGEVDDELAAWRVVPVYEVFTRLPPFAAIVSEIVPALAGPGFMLISTSSKCDSPFLSE